MESLLGPKAMEALLAVAKMKFPYFKPSKANAIHRISQQPFFGEAKKAGKVTWNRE